MKMEEIDNAYKAGSCNIGAEEIKIRKNAFYISLIFNIVVLFVLVGWDIARAWSLIFFIPAFFLGITFSQYYYKFCVKYGLLGFYNFGKTGKTKKINSNEFRKKDIRKSLMMIISSFIFGAVAAGILFYLK